MDKEGQGRGSARSRDDLAREIRRYRYRSWGTQPTPDGRWECYFDVAETRGGARLRSYGETEIDAMERMTEILAREGIDRA